MDLHTGYSVSITPDGGSATVINGITQQAIRTNSEHTAEATAGNAYANHGAITAIKPVGSFTSYDLATVIDLLGLRGACLAGGAAAGAEFYQLALDACGLVKSGTVHRKVIVPNGLAVPRTISVSHRQHATIDAEVLTHYDGTNNPLIPTESVAAPTSLAACPRFALGTIDLGGTTLTGNLSLEFDFGNEAASDGGDSEPFDTHIEIPQVVPKIRIRGREVAKFAASGGFPLGGAKGTHANTSIILRKWVAGTNGFSDDADNIEVTGEVMVSVDEGFSAQANRRGEISLMLTALDDGTNAPLVFDTAYDPTPI